MKKKTCLQWLEPVVGRAGLLASPHLGLAGFGSCHARPEMAWSWNPVTLFGFFLSSSFAVHPSPPLMMMMTGRAELVVSLNVLFGL